MSIKTYVAACELRDTSNARLREACSSGAAPTVIAGLYELHQEATIRAGRAFPPGFTTPEQLADARRELEALELLDNGLICHECGGGAACVDGCSVGAKIKAEADNDRAMRALDRRDDQRNEAALDAWRGMEW